MQRARARIGASPDALSKTGGAEQESEDTASESSAPTRGGEDRPLDPARLREGNYLAARELAAAHGLDQFVMPIDMGFGFFIEAPEPSAVPPEDKDKPIGREQGLVLSGVRSRIWWTLSLIADQLAPTHLGQIGLSYPASWLVELFTELPKRRPDKDALQMLHVLVGEPSSQAPVWDALTDPSLTEQDTATLYQLIGHSRALRTRAEEGAIAIWKAAE